MTRWMVVTTSSPGSGYFHACSAGMAHLGFHQVHFADAALILLEGGDALGIGRPQHDGPVAAGPAGIVGGVAEILDAVGGERGLLIGGRRRAPRD